jgi:hypothetical protein
MGTVTRDKTRGALTHYASIAEMEEDCLRGTYRQDYNRSVLQRAVETPRQGGGVSWYGVESLDKVKECLVKGYPEGAALVDSLYESIAPSLPRAIEFRRKRVRGEQGDALDIHAVNRGALDKAWETTRRRPHHGSGIIRIAVDICGNAHVNADKLRWRGVASLALSRAMSKAGYSVEIVAGQSGANAFEGHPSVHGTITVTVKPRYAAIDTATIAASVCLPGFFRYLGFASIIKQADDLGYAVECGLGRAEKLETLLPVPERVAQVVVPETVNDLASAKAWVVTAINMLQGATISKEQT